MLKQRSAYRVLARRASGAHVLNGPIMLHRMAKRVRAVEHHSCYPITSRCGRSTGRALRRPPRPRFASARRVLRLPKSFLLTVRPRRSLAQLAASGKSIRWLSVTLWSPSTTVPLPSDGRHGAITPRAGKGSDETMIRADSPLLDTARILFLLHVHSPLATSVDYGMDPIE